MKKILLDLGRNPTIEELQAFFIENDFTKDTYIDRDYDKLPNNTVEFVEEVKGMMGENFEPLARERGD